MTGSLAAIGSLENLADILGALVTLGAGVEAWTTTVAAAGDLSPVTIAPSTEQKNYRPSLISSYIVTGVDADGKPYNGSGTLDISLSPSGSGAMELDWDNGKILALVQVIENVLAAASLTKDRCPMILVTEINSDGSLSGKWARRARMHNPHLDAPAV